MAFAFELLLAEELLHHVSSNVRVRFENPHARLRIHEPILNRIHFFGTVAFEVETERVRGAALQRCRTVFHHERVLRFGEEYRQVGVEEQGFVLLWCRFWCRGFLQEGAVCNKQKGVLKK